MKRLGGPEVGLASFEPVLQEEHEVHFRCYQMWPCHHRPELPSRHGHRTMQRQHDAVREEGPHSATLFEVKFVFACLSVASYE